MWKHVANVYELLVFGFVCVYIVREQILGVKHHKERKVRLKWKANRQLNGSRAQIMVSIVRFRFLVFRPFILIVLLYRLNKTSYDICFSLVTILFRRSVVIDEWIANKPIYRIIILSLLILDELLKITFTQLDESNQQCWCRHSSV